MIANLQLVPAVLSTVKSPSSRMCDGIICFGGVDWWYHNRGHYDIQMMRELSERIPVLYVNSIGMRMPRPGRSGQRGVFVGRIRRKLASVRRGLVRVRPGFSVFSPVSVPGRGVLAGSVRSRALPAQVRWAARRLGIKRPLVWVACPPAADALDRIPHAGLIYQRTDRYEAFHGVDPAQITSFDRVLKARADVTLFCSRTLFEQEGPGCRSAAYVDHGVDFERFESAGDGGEVPGDVAAVPRPRVGFVGGIDAHTFDPDLFRDVAARCPEMQFVMVGACSLPDGWCELPNVHLFGRRDYTEVAAYMAACDVLIMPWNSGEWIRACNPVKLKEYLAVGRPVVSTPFEELTAYGNLVRVAADARSFAAAIRASSCDVDTGKHDASPGRGRVREQTWRAKSEVVVARLENCGVRLLTERSAQ